ncbi:MAG: hypothetical protein LBL91_05405 [Lachnospiraceae bacterium]|jgi:Mn-dependent DtxR family transcriptional regulator|nr:hypothetical protein [Lachnospiraceae bacterium]
MTVKEDIIKMFFYEHKGTNIIAKELNVSPPYVTKIIKEDLNRYIVEKQKRLKTQKEKRKKYEADWIRKKRNADRTLDESIKIQHKQASIELSYKSELSDLAYAKYNRSAYCYDKKSSGLVLRKGINAGYAVSQKVSDIINPNCIKSTKMYV